ncbi:hypothetical protein [Nocardioides sp. HB32]
MSDNITTEDQLPKLPVSIVIARRRAWQHRRSFRCLVGPSFKVGKAVHCKQPSSSFIN